MSAAFLTGGIMLLATGIIYLITQYQSWSKHQKELNNLQSEANKSVQSEISRITTLERILKNTNNTYQQRRDALRQLQELMPDYNASLATEGKLIESNTDALEKYITQLKNAALAKAANDKLSAAAEKLFDFDHNMDSYERQVWNEEIEDEELLVSMMVQREKLQKEVDKWADVAEGYTADTLGKIKQFSKAYYQELVNENQRLLDNMTDAELTSDIGIKARTALDAAQAKLDLWNKNYTKKGEIAAEKARRAAEQLAAKQKKADEDLAKKISDYQKRIDASRIAAMQESAAKERAGIQAEYEETKRLIAQELYDIAELENITGKPATAQRTKLIELDASVSAEYEAKLREVADKSKKILSEIMGEVSARFESELNNNIRSINKYYDDLILEAQKADAKQEDIDLLGDTRTKEVEQARITAKIQSLEFDMQVAARRLAISGKYYLFESDKVKQSVQQQKKALEERLALMKKQYAASQSDELAKDIRLATVEIEEMNRALRNLDVEKMQELAGYVNQISGGLQGIFANDASTSKVFEWTAGLASSAGKMLSGDPKEMIEGIMQAISTIADVFSTGSKVRKEIREFYRELEVIATQFAVSVINSIKDAAAGTDSIFDTDMTNRLNKGMEGYNAAIEKQRELTDRLGDTTVAVDKKKRKFLGITTGSKTVWESVLTGYKKILDTDEELIDAGGNLNREMAEALLNSGKLSKEAEDLIRNILSASDAATEAMQQVEDTLSGIVGNIGDSLRDALVEAFKSGDITAAADSFGKSMTSILEGYISKLMFTSVFGEMLSDLETRMKESYGEGGDGDISDDIVWFAQNYQDGVDKYVSGMEKWKEQLAAKGIDVFSDGNREGASAGIERITQESANELNGNFYALLQQVGDIRNMKKEAAVMHKALQEQIDRIAENSDFLQYLPDIKNGIDKLNKGVKVKV